MSCAWSLHASVSDHGDVIARDERLPSALCATLMTSKDSILVRLSWSYLTNVANGVCEPFIAVTFLAVNASKNSSLRRVTLTRRR